MNPTPKGDLRTPAPAQPGLLRSMNNRVVLELLIERGLLSRGDVHELTGLSKPTASQLLVRLEESGLVLPGGFGETGPGGRAPQLYRINPRAGFAAAVDVRPGSISTRVCDITGAIVAEHETDTLPSERGAENAALAVAECCAKAGITIAQLDGIVIGVPGSYDVAADLLRYAEHLPGWHDAGLGEELHQQFDRADVSLENDVNLVALAELRASGHDDETFFLLWLGEGIGGALMIDGSVFRGSRGAAGEAAFMLPPGSRIEDRDRSTGGFEDLIGIEALQDLALTSGHNAGSWSESLAVLLDDPAAAGAVQEIARRYALGLASVIALVDPARMILAGELATIGGERLRRTVAEQLDLLVLAAPPIELATTGQSPILDGAMLMSLDLARERVFTT